MTAVTLNPPVAPYQWSDQKIECFVHDRNAKNRLRDNLASVDWILGRPKVTRDAIRDIVEQFAEGISQKSHLFARTSFWGLVYPFAKAVAQVLQHNPKKVSVQITNAPSIYILAEIGNQNLHFDLQFSEETGKFEEAVVNIFSNKTQQMNVFGSIEEVALDIEKYFKPQNTSRYYYGQSFYEIPGQTYSPLAF